MIPIQQIQGQYFGNRIIPCHSPRKTSPESLLHLPNLAMSRSFGRLTLCENWKHIALFSKHPFWIGKSSNFRRPSMAIYTTSQTVEFPEGTIIISHHSTTISPISNHYSRENSSEFVVCIYISTTTYHYTIWLVVSIPLKNISQLGLLLPIHGKKKCSKPPNSHHYITTISPFNP